ncbi:beta-ketoacyl synthase N-terminal-like domain-containing protein [Brevibacillus fulvus]|uniref:3-oxoacyl-(Acyl-carrier-protein) synthase n=1 Tax=Brevibacillus fulvus TaxID=1125967 RepID=A0A938Y164_9BACL|nr:beta-ketoacyl synthase N-terminal-like domain-containing protein [Brevibacillus fulvus]MBM7589692.1 3-oxoacyl-(acyl-carrier-protein) synthase [Brevibacillus fulvus]
MSAAKVCVTGTSMLTSLGIGNDEVWEGVLRQQNAISERTYHIDHREHICYPVHPIQLPDLRDWLPSPTYSWIEEAGLHQDADFVLLLVAAMLALRDANLQVDDFSHVSLVLGHENLGVVSLLDKLLTADGGKEEAFTLRSFAKYQENFFNIQSFPHLFYLAKALGLKGMTLTINNACATGLYGLEVGSRLIQSGQTDVVIVVCSDYSHVTEYLWLAQKGLISPTGELRPFDKNRNGSILGDGAGAFVLESAEHARKRKAKVVCSYAGGYFKQESWKMTLPDVTNHAYSEVIAGVIAKNGAMPVDLLVPHGAGSQLWDLYEAVEIRQAFSALGREIPPVTAFKGYIGHTLGASGLVESVLLVESLKRNLLPPSLHYRQPDPKIGLPLVTETVEKELRTVLKAVSAYGGFYAAVLFQRDE